MGRKHTFDIAKLDLFLQCGQRQIAHRRFELVQIAGPVLLTQRIQRRGRQPARRAGAAFHQLRQHQRGDLRNLLGELAHRGQREHQFGQTLREFGVELVFGHQAPGLDGRKGDHARLVLLGARQQELQVLLLAACEAPQIVDKQYAARRTRQHIRR